MISCWPSLLGRLRYAFGIAGSKTRKYIYSVRMFDLMESGNLYRGFIDYDVPTGTSGLDIAQPLESGYRLVPWLSFKQNMGKSPVSTPGLGSKSGLELPLQDSFPDGAQHAVSSTLFSRVSASAATDSPKRFSAFLPRPGTS